MIPVTEALAHLFALVAPLESENVPLAQAAGRVLAAPLTARRDQPPFAASAMDGYALNAVEADVGAQFKVIGEAAAGHGFSGRVGPGQCVRIFTGAPLPEGTDRVVMQEDVMRSGAIISLLPEMDSAAHVRPRGADFATGDQIEAPRPLGPADLALIAAMNIAEVPVVRRPDVALIATGDELVMPGETPGPDQIIASNTFGLKAMIEAAGGTARMLPIARDTRASLTQAFALARGADLVVSIGGASVGDHDLVGDVAADLGMTRAFYKVAMRPGKPLMAGRMGADMGGAAMLGLPGNPVSAMVCAQVFLVPMLRKMLHLGENAAPRRQAPLARALPANGPREHYMRARLESGALHPDTRQDSALLSVLARADALLIRPPHDPAREVGEQMSYLPTGT